MDEKDIKQKDYTFENQKIVSVQMEKEVRQSFIEYAMSVIVSPGVAGRTGRTQACSPSDSLRHV